MTNEQKKNILNLIGSFISILLASSLFSGLGRFIFKINFRVGILDGLFIGLAIFLVLHLPRIFSRLSQYSAVNSIIFGFICGVISGIISKSIFIVSGISGSLLCSAFVITEKYLHQKQKNILEILLNNFLGGVIAGSVSGAIFSIYVDLALGHITSKSIVMGLLNWAIWGGLITLGIKLAILYLEPIISFVFLNIFTYLVYGLITGIGTGIFGVIIQTINYQNTNFDMTDSSATFTQTITFSFIRDAMFGFTLGLIFALLTRPKLFKKFGKFWTIMPGGLSAFLSLKLVHRFFTFALSPITGGILGIGLGLGLALSEKYDEKKKRQINSLINSSGFGFLAVILSGFIEGTIKGRSLFFILGFGILGAIYAAIIIFSKLLCEYYFEKT